MSLITTYNVKNNKAALVGNWVEEDALRDKTGHARRKVPAPYFAPDRKESRIEPTYERVLLHDTPAKLTCNSHASEFTPPRFETTLQASHRYADYAVEKPGPGPRSSLRDQYLAETAQRLHSEQRARERDEQQQECHEAARTTIAKSSYLPTDTSALVKDRIPRGRNGSLARQVDPNVQHLTKAQTDSIDQMKLDLLQDTTVTRYSYAVTTGVGLNFATTVSDGSNAFGRSSTFTNELNDPSKRHGEATEPGSLHDERNGASVHQRSALKRLLNVLKGDPDTAQRLLDTLRFGPAKSARTDQPQQEDEREYIEIHDFRAAFTATGAALPANSVVRGLPAILTNKEVIHIFMYFDVDNIGAIQVRSFVDFCSGLGDKYPFVSPKYLPWDPYTRTTPANNS
ncbi:hypothetical protein F441_09455 [Phytophthora nicotianae CJ01A1]|uniref:EF-hand domain-containing protein n=4 Tax=Phytophthora nicotianae TaxID=4792 RepID=W2ZAE5_PHYNI|nr:hypothetical protein L915_09317 [Phytophthora nicotianae]ETO74753.1 hypothetical protein F444_09581 [Phytophthora nicotianae P1976]ETP15888.1 hypothetical protein F441_09455 [Phytophthora nicotianae CJ01A1]ETP43941.1 hypothetical protein F442_09425 [Phytophthora nicotianae P10297]ETL39449.1 hypothetical protein L916_09220 [Phytophthora nicotianae]